MPKRKNRLTGKTPIPQQEAPYTKLQLDIFASECPTCNSGEIVFGSEKHGEVVFLSYKKGTGVLQARCPGCQSVVAEFKIAES